MTAKILALQNQKRDDSKTTAAMEIASQLSILGARVLVVDADAQQTAVGWARLAPIDKQFPATVIGMASYAETMRSFV